MDPISGYPRASHSATCDVIAGKDRGMFIYFEICLSQCQWVAVHSAAVTITFLVVAERSMLPADPALAQPPTKGPLPLVHRWTFSEFDAFFYFSSIPNL